MPACSRVAIFFSVICLEAPGKPAKSNSAAPRWAQERHVEPAPECSATLCVFLNRSMPWTCTFRNQSTPANPAVALEMTGSGLLSVRARRTETAAHLRSRGPSSSRSTVIQGKGIGRGRPGGCGAHIRRVGRTYLRLRRLDGGRYSAIGTTTIEHARRYRSHKNQMFDHVRSCQRPSSCA